MTFTLNDDPESLQVLPPIGSDLEDKIMLFQVSPYPVPTDQTAKKGFRAQLAKEMPGFIHHLLSWTIQEECGALAWAYSRITTRS